MKKKIFLRSLEIIFRILCLLTFLNMISLKSNDNGANSPFLYELLSSVFYCSLLLFIIIMIRRLTKTVDILDEIQPYLAWAKWIMLIETTFLLGLKLKMQLAVIGDKMFNPLDLGKVMLPNLGFIIITLFVFYLSALLKEMNKIKQENDLTI